MLHSKELMKITQLFEWEAAMQVINNLRNSHIIISGDENIVDVDQKDDADIIAGVDEKQRVWLKSCKISNLRAHFWVGRTTHAMLV